VGLLVVSTTPDYAQESLGFENIRDSFPDRKFLLGSSCSGKPVDSAHSNSDLITAAELVSLPSMTRKLQIA
jgi:hypothetical protein